MKPCTIKMDGKVWKLWTNGTPVKEIKGVLELTQKQVYHALTRERRRRGLSTDWKPGKNWQKKGKKGKRKINIG